MPLGLEGAEEKASLACSGHSMREGAATVPS